MFKQHLAMIGYNESPNKKAKFWQSYIRSLKGSEDIRAQESRDEYRRPLSIYDEPTTAAGRITVPGYRYLPVSRETYGYSPRNIYAHQTTRPASLARAPINAQQAFDSHVERMKELERRYPSRYGLYLRDKHAPCVLSEEYEPETKPYYRK
ncbi:unnamed protein product [Diamesa serratosioi]